MRVPIDQRSHSTQITDLGGRPDVHRCAAGNEVREHLTGRRCDVTRHVTPAAIVIVAVGELDRPRAILPSRVDVGATGEQLVDDVDLPRHHRPMNRLIGSSVAGMQKLGRGIQQALDLFNVAFPDRRGHGFALR